MQHFFRPEFHLLIALFFAQPTRDGHGKAELFLLRPIVRNRAFGRLTQRNLARAGCDYWDEVEIVRWACADAFLEAHGRDELHLFTGRANRLHTDVRYGDGAFLVFGRESAGIDPAILDRFESGCVRIPMREGLRSLNLSNAVAIGVYEALRQQSFNGLV